MTLYNHASRWLRLDPKIADGPVPTLLVGPCRHCWMNEQSPIAAEGGRQ